MFRLKERCISTSVYRKNTHTGRYLNYFSNHSDLVKLGVARSLYDRAKNICSSTENYRQEIKEISKALRRNGYPTKISIQARREHKRNNNFVFTINNSIPYIQGFSEILRNIGKRYNICSFQK